jgi:hypothetical protein
VPGLDLSNANESMELLMEYVIAKKVHFRW